MKVLPMSSNLAAATTGTAALSFPVWVQVIPSAHEALLAVLGFVLLVLTIRAKILEIRIKRETLRELRDHGGDT